jgi:hypothetical protein
MREIERTLREKLGDEKIRFPFSNDSMSCTGQGNPTAFWKVQQVIEHTNKNDPF